MKRTLLYSIIFLFTLVSVCSARIINVPNDQPTIQEGIDIAVDGDTVLVEPGTYVENINFNGKNIVVGSFILTTADTSYISQTVIDGNFNGSVITFNSNEDTTTVLSGFTIKNGTGTLFDDYIWGGGIYCISSSPKLMNLKITGNRVRNLGGGVYLGAGSRSRLSHVEVSGNQAGGYGGGILINNSKARLTHVVVSDNIADRGGGIYSWVDADPYLYNVTIVKNTARYYGGGFYSNGGDPNLVNVTISGNVADSIGGGIFVRGYTNTSLGNTIVWDNNPEEIYLNPNLPFVSIDIRYSDIQNGPSGISNTGDGIIRWLEGNIDSNPLFCDTGIKDYLLAENSPCVGTGENENNIGAFGVGCGIILSDQSEVEHVIWDGNWVSTVHGNHGDFVSYHVNHNSTLEWPKGSGKHAVFQAGLWLAAGKVNGVEEIRTAVSEYRSEFVPGSVYGGLYFGKIYQLHRAELDAFLNNDWAIFSSMILELPQTIIEGEDIYTERIETQLPTDDFINWPTEDGAPWIDFNNDGVYNPEYGDYPDIIGDMFHWYVMNDLDSTVHQNLMNTKPLGVEVQASMFGFDQGGPIGNTVFIKYRIENVGNDDLDSIFAALWSDPDLGDASDDLIGVDSMLSIAYCYNDNNGDHSYGTNPPAVGHTILQTPITSSQGDTAFVSGSEIVDYKNIPIHAIGRIRKFWPIQDPNNGLEVYQMLNGINNSDLPGQPIVDPVTGENTRFICSGDPITGEGWLDNAPGDRRMFISAGPFSLAPGDVQEVVAALILSQGESNLQSVATLQEDTRFLHTVWNNDFTFMNRAAQISEIDRVENTEDTGPFLLKFGIEPNQGWELGSETFWIHYGLDMPADSLPLVIIDYEGQETYAVWIPEYPVLGTTELHYYLKIFASDGTEMLWPAGAPYNYETKFFGPDTTAPVITGLSELADVHYQIPFTKTVRGKIEDDRFDITSQLKWQVGNGTVYIEPMLPDTIIDTYNYPEKVISNQAGSFSRSTLNLDDTVHYWIEARDHSRNQNLGMSERKWFIARDELTIGNWEEEKLDEWDFWYLGYIINDPFGDWGLVALVELREKGIQDSCVLNQPLNLLYTTTAGLEIPMSRQMTVDEDFGYIELSKDGETWQTVYSVTGDSLNEILDINLKDYVRHKQVYFRLRVERNSQRPVWWMIDDIIFHTDSTRLEVSEPVYLPTNFALHQNFPNPFNPITTIRYELPRFSNVRLSVYDILGREVAQLIDTSQDPGLKEVQWNATNVSSGIYFVQMLAGDFRQVRKVMVLK